MAMTESELRILWDAKEAANQRWATLYRETQEAGYHLRPADERFELDVELAKARAALGAAINAFTDAAGAP